MPLSFSRPEGHGERKKTIIARTNTKVREKERKTIHILLRQTPVQDQAGH